MSVNQRSFKFLDLCEGYMAYMKLSILALTSLLMVASGVYYYPGNLGFFLGFIVVYSLILWQLLFTRFSWFFFFFSVFILLAYPFRFLMHLYLNTELSFSGLFDYLPGSYDQMMLLATIGGAALLIAKFCLDALIKRYRPSLSEPYQLSDKFRQMLFWGVLLAVLLLAGFNEYFEVVRAGLASKTVFPYKLTALVYWCFVLGVVFLLSFAVGGKVKSRSKVDRHIALVLLATFTVACTTYSRAPLVLLALPVLMAVVYVNFHLLDTKRIVSYILLWVVVLLLSIVSVANLRIDAFKDAGRNLAVDEHVVVMPTHEPNHYHGYQSQYWNILGLLLDRWPGLEGIASVISYPERGWPLMAQGLSESYKKGVNGIYQKISFSPYLKMSDNDKSKYIFRSSCGFIGFFYYSDSRWFIFIGTAMVLFVFGLFEQVLYALSMGNAVLTAAIGSKLAFEFLQLTIPKSLGVYLVELIVTLFTFHIFLKVMGRCGLLR